MRVALSLSPGGLLLPYHMGVLESLRYHGAIHQDATHIAGSSAGAIATVAFGCGISPTAVLERTIQMSDTCQTLGGARGRLLSLLRHDLEELIQEEEMERLQQRTGLTGVAYLQLFPHYQAMLQHEFDTSHDVCQAVCFSSTFPFFSTNWPVAWDINHNNNNNINKVSLLSSPQPQPPKRNFLPRILVDGFFSVPRDRFGCPDLETMAPPHVVEEVERTVTVSVFPQSIIGLRASHPEDCISPAVDEGNESEQMKRLIRLATQSSSRAELTQVYESGWHDGERWCRANSNKEKIVG